MMELDKLYITIAQKVATKAIDLFFSSLANIGKVGSENNRDDPIKKLSATIERKLSTHLSMVASWSEKFLFYRMPSPMDVGRNTIKLRLRTIPRRYSDKKESKVVYENDLLDVSDNIVLLGDPGAGKTTTLKRISKTLMSSDATSDNDTYQYPLLIRLRYFNDNVDGKDVLVRIIADEMGIPYEKKEDKYYVTDEPAMHAVPTLLDKTGALVLLDGLDEVAKDCRSQIENEIESLALNTNEAKIILTCRTGDYNRSIGYFRKFEVNPLSEKEIKQIASKWLSKKKDEFLSDLESLPYGELATRPLFLTQILVLYSNIGYLPQQPQDIYRMILMLMIREWDEDRGIKRVSIYAQFEPERKLDFLAHFSYELTYKICKKQFSNRMLIDVYNKIHSYFRLPPGEAKLVASEIESHTGIIIEAGYNQYEFSHLTLQEFLCAHYLVRSPMAPSLANIYLKNYPAPLAVATAYSSDPSAWFAIVLLHKKNYMESTLSNLLTLLNRMLIEKPCFSINTTLGYCVLYFIFFTNNKQNEGKTALIDKLEESYRALIDSSAEVRESVLNALSSYHIVGECNTSSLCRLHLNNDWNLSNEYEAEIPVEGEISMSWLNFLIDESWITIEDLKRHDVY